MKKEPVPLILFLLLFVMSLSVFAAPVVHDPSYSIDIVASGLGAAHGVEIGPTGDIFVSNYQGNVFKIDKVTYTVETYASVIPYSLDLTFDNFGHLFVLSGSGNPRDVFQVFADGSSSLFSTGYSHTVGLEAGPDGKLYLGNTGDGTISRVNSLGIGETFLTGLAQPRGLAFDDSGNLYFVETATGDIHKSTLAGLVSLVATLGPFRGTFIEVDSSGAIYVADDPTASIYKIHGNDITLFASGFAGNANPPALGPLGLAFDSSGNLFVADGEYLWKISPAVKPITIDIKPESCPNPLNIKSQGVLPVAILGTADFYVANVDPASIRLAGVAPFRSTVEDVATPVADPQNGCDCNELGGDGINDLALKFNTQEIVNAFGEVEDGEELELTVTGMLTDGTPFEGKDCIVIHAKGGKGKVEEPEQCYGVPKTGQTICYSTGGDVIDCAGTGQDGDLLKGVVCPEPSKPRFTDNDDGTITDNCTGLVWLKDANCFGRQSWADALTVCNNLAMASGSCGLTDGSIAGEWRLPNIFELFSLLDFGETNPALPPGHPFSIFDQQTWSSSTHMRETHRAWHVHYNDGRVNYSDKINENNFWCVKGGN